MLDPFNITNFNMPLSQKEEFLIAAVAVAGKTAKTIFPKTDDLLNNSIYKKETPFKTIENMLNLNVLQSEMERVKIGKYGLLTKTFKYIVYNQIDLSKDVTSDELEKIPGVSFKTSRFYLLHSVYGMRIAVLDTHILKYLKSLEYPDIPTHTPDKKNYSRIEEYFFTELDKSGKSAAEFDLFIWNLYSKK